MLFMGDRLSAGERDTTPPPFPVAAILFEFVTSMSGLRGRGLFPTFFSFCGVVSIKSLQLLLLPLLRPFVVVVVVVVAAVGLQEGEGEGVWMRRGIEDDDDDDGDGDGDGDGDSCGLKELFILSLSLSFSSDTAADEDRCSSILFNMSMR